MEEFRYNFDPADRVTVGTVGQPGDRTFYLQARYGRERVSLVVEKEQVQALAEAIEQLLENLTEQNPLLSTPEDVIAYADMSLEQPLEEAFRVGRLGLGYDEGRDLLVIIAQEIGGDDTPQADLDVARITMLREQARALAREGNDIVQRGRPRCPQCGEPMNSSGHFCIKKNGQPIVTYEM